MTLYTLEMACLDGSRWMCRSHLSAICRDRQFNKHQMNMNPQPS